MSRRASLPGADELFRRTDRAPSERSQAAERKKQESTKLKVAPETQSSDSSPRAPKHDEKITFYCKGKDLLALEQTRLLLRGEHGIAADRGRIVRAALAYVLEDFEARGEDSVLIRELREH